MKNENQIRFNRSFTSVFTFVIGCVLALFSLRAAAQTTMTADGLLAKIDRQEAIELDGVTIIGDLNFAKLKKKYRGGSYGVRQGVVKEYFTKLLAPLTLRNCVIKGEIITYSETEKPGIVRHNFTAFDEMAIFENCVFEDKVAFEKMTFYQGIEFRNCTFREGVKFIKVHFSQPPVFEGNKVEGKLLNRETNWTGENAQLAPPPPQRETVTLLFKNSSLKDIDIRFGRTTWTLNPLGHSSLITEPGEEIYLKKKGSEERLILTVTDEMEGAEFDVAKL